MYWLVFWVNAILIALFYLLTITFNAGPA
jgi:hypothetical protein